MAPDRPGRAGAARACEGAAVSLTAATAATAEDRMRVPEELAHGLSELLVVYLIARTLR